MSPQPEETTPENVSALLSELQTHPEYGLSSEEAVKRLKLYGANRPTPSRRKTGGAVLGFLKEPMIWLLIIAAVVYLALGETTDASVLLIAIIPIGATDFILERRAEKTLEKLRKVTAAKVEVLRDQTVSNVLADELVPGDILLVKEGDVVAADSVLLSTSELQADESSLTGESTPSVKEALPTVKKGVFGNEGTIFAGTKILSGRGKSVIIATGTNTEYGRIGRLVAGITTGRTPLQESIDHLVRILGIVAAVAFTAVITLELALGEGFSNALIAAVSLAIAAIPEEFPVIFTLFLTLGAWRMARHNALMRRLVGVETLGSVSVICTDKTGTLTTGKMRVEEVALGDSLVYASDMKQDETAKRFIETAVLACEIEPFDTLEQAILEFASKTGFEPPQFYGARKLEREYSFDPRGKYMSHIWVDPKGGRLLCAKGSVESILKLSKPDSPEQQAAPELNRQMTEKGDRVIALAQKKIIEITGDRGLDEIELEFVGLIGLSDPVRAGVKESVKECQDAGIRVVMLTGDHPLTAHSIAEKIDLIHADELIHTGPEIGGMNDEEFQEALLQTTIFARLLPEQKLRIVEGYQQLGKVVAVTGDGINDAPALRKADIGVAMGKRGTEVAREAATMVLMDDNFSTIVEAVREGRRIFDNLQKAFSYLIAFHLPIILLALIIPLFGLPLLLLPIHIIWMELILHPTVSIVFGEEPPEPGIMKRPPRGRSSEALIERGLSRPLAEGATLTVAALLLYLYYIGPLGVSSRTVAITTLISGQLALVIFERSRRGAWLRGFSSNRYLAPILAVSFLTLLIAVYLPGLDTVVRLPPISPELFAFALLIGVLSTSWVSVARLVRTH